jgi:trehalose/maltose hydrolase-like predicted phosphorylase
VIRAEASSVLRPPSVHLNQTFEAIVAGPGMIEETDARRLGARGVYVCVVGEPPDACHEDSLSRRFGSAASAAVWLEQRGITGRLILVLENASTAGVRSLGLRLACLGRASYVVVDRDADGPERVRQVVDEQMSRRDSGRVPGIDDDPSWTVVLPSEPALERVAESLGALGNGYCGMRASHEDARPSATPLQVVAGVYGVSDDAKLVPAPRWSAIGVDQPGGRRVLDLRTGVLAHIVDDEARSLRFVSVAQRHALALRAEAVGDAAQASELLIAPTAAAAFARSPVSDDAGARTEVAWTVADGHAGIATAIRERRRASAGRWVVERVAACVDVRPGEEPQTVARDRLDSIDHAGFDRLLAEHRAEWARRWAGAHVAIDGDAETELAARWAVFHLLSAARGEDEVAVGARGLTGPAYGGHVFWDADVFVLPALAALDPPAARAMVEYRIRRLPAARAAAAVAGRRGARFPWESAGDGTDVTPRSGINRHGDRVAIRTGELEEHISADIAWSVCEYAAWTGDQAVLAGPGRDVVEETARYWASRIELDADGGAHVRNVIGPDEYHELVDDNAFTNVMARWNLRRAAALASGSRGDPEEVSAWQALADALGDGFDPERGVYEQFAGYFAREPLIVADIGGPLIPADIMLGATRIAGSQVIKQADVLMLHHLVPDEVVPGSLPKNLDYYLPRTAHGSSLSPAIHAALLARAGRPDDALGLFRLAARLDLDDLTGTTAGGLHLATLGGTWQALAYGFLGVRVHADRLDVDPQLPTAWRSLTLRFWFHGEVLTVSAGHDSVEISSPVALVIGMSGSLHRCSPGTTLLAIGGAR